MKDENASLNILEYIVNITSITNKWLMWCEENSPNQSVFVPSIFQMRDAFSHFIKLFGEGMKKEDFEKNAQDLNRLFEHEYSVKQLEEAFTHCTRAFYDCADHILLFIKEDVEESERNNDKMFLGLKNKLIKYNTYIAELRSSKSEDMSGNYENIEKWDLFLQVITSEYVFADIEFELFKLINEVKSKLNIIESKYSSDIIKNHSPHFYEQKHIIIELEELPKEYEAYLNDDSILSKEVLENSQKWCNKILDELNDRIRRATEYSAQLDGLQKIMSNSNVVEKRKGFLKAIWGLISTIISWITTSYLSSRFVFEYTIALPNQGETISVQKLNIMLVIPFILIGSAVFIIGYNVIKLIIKKILGKWID